MFYILVVLVYLIIGFLGTLPLLKKNKGISKAVIYIFILIPSLIINLLLIAKVKIPSIAHIIEQTMLAFLGGQGS